MPIYFVPVTLTVDADSIGDANREAEAYMEAASAHVKGCANIEAVTVEEHLTAVYVPGDESEAIAILPDRETWSTVSGMSFHTVTAEALEALENGAKPADVPMRPACVTVFDNVGAE